MRYFILTITVISCYGWIKHIVMRKHSMFRLRSKPELHNSIRIFNTLSRKKESFIPQIPGKVSFYSCGPTVYDYAHIGNFRAFLTYDIIKRWFQYCGFDVYHVCNLTDVDDKIINKMFLENKTLQAVTERFTSAFFDDLDALNIIRAAVYPKATEHIHEMENMIKSLVQSGHAYEKDNSVYFRASSVQKTQQFAQININHTDQLQQTEQADQSESNQFTRRRTQLRGVEDKENPLDFALWKASTQSEGGVGWNSKFGFGRPGWHTECSAMCHKYLGDTVDIHAGGVDLIFPHHANEIAQSESFTGKILSRYWMHNGFINIENNKMSKSLKNFKTLREIVKSPTDVRAFRYIVVSSQYRNGLSFTEESFTAARNSLRRIDRTVTDLQHIIQDGREKDGRISTQRKCSSSSGGGGGSNADGGDGISERMQRLCGDRIKEFESAMCDDLNAPRATAALFRLINAADELIASKDANKPESAQIVLDTIFKMNEVFGILYVVPPNYNIELKDSVTNRDEDNISQATQLACERSELKKNKRFMEADLVRENIRSLGFGVHDLDTGGFTLHIL